MGLIDSDWLSHYDSRINNVTTEFFIPALSRSTVYRRIAGLFSSTSFALCARGAREFIANCGLMQLIISPILTKEEIEAISESKNVKDIVTNSLSIQLERIQDEFEKNHINALKFLLKKGFLEIRVDIPKDEKGTPLDVDSIVKHNILSEKRGIFQDRDGHVISFRGPVNESADNWEKSTYEITVDQDWIEGQKQHVLDDIKIFDDKWNDPEIIPLPKSIEDQLIITAPEIQDIDLEKYNYPPWAHIPNNGVLWPHQIRAVNAWIKNDYYGIFTMATGSGKTITALTAVNIGSEDMLVIIVAYGKVLVRQWEKEVKKYDDNADVIICDSDTNWKDILPGKLVPFLQGTEPTYKAKRVYVITTPQTGCLDRFQSNFRNIDTARVQLIADEVHHLGAQEFSNVFKLKTLRRIGLSATYRRDWDEPGTQAILSYFGRALEEATYSISDAIKDGRLCKYKYLPHFAYLNRDEFSEYVEITLEIRRQFGKLGIRENSLNLPILPPNIERLLRNRAEIIKKCQGKILTFGEIISKHPKRPYVVFADDNIQARQLESAHKEKIREMNQSSDSLIKDDIMYFSGELDNWQRDTIILDAKNRGIPLISMYCLDEGVDIPELSSAIVVSSSSSKRQYIQRRGRILRLGERNKIAEFYDMIVFAQPDPDPVRNDIAKDIIAKERERLHELAADSVNKYEAILKIENEIEKAGFNYIL